MRYSPLDAEHRTLGAKLVEFGGWEMPLSYGHGTLAEHHACRNDAAMFDVSHLGTVRLEGADSFDRLQKVLTNDLSRIRPGKAQYTHLLDEDDASVLDDIIVWWVDEDCFDVMPNASNTERVVAAIGGTDTTATRAIIAVQGPHSREKVSRIWREAAMVPRFHVARCEFMGVQCVVAGTGYTGEDGIEIAVPVEQAGELWKQLLAVDIAAAGLGARDTLRLEAALPLHGHELGPGITPLQANLEWVVAWTKNDFRGKTALLQEKSTGVARKLFGLSIDGRRPAREGSVVADSSGNNIGTVTSGNYSPTLGHCIALCLLSGEHQVGEKLTVDVRGTQLEATIAPTPFVKSSQKK